MLDTRKLSAFLRPQNIVDAVNEFGRGKSITFSDWRNGLDVNFVITRLLEEHIALVCSDEENRAKLVSTARKVGYPLEKKILIASDQFTPQFLLIEPFLPDQMLLSFGYLTPRVEVAACLVVELEPEPSTRIFNFSKPIVNQPLFASRMASMKITEDLRSAFLHICFGAANIFTYLLFVEVETVEVPARKKFLAKKYEGFVNKQEESIPVADLNWSKESIDSLPFGVSGHFKSQSYGPGWSKWRLIYINPYFKSGYAKKSGKEKILGKK